MQLIAPENEVRCCRLMLLHGWMKKADSNLIAPENGRGMERREGTGECHGHHKPLERWRDKLAVQKRRLPSSECLFSCWSCFKE